MQSGSSPPRCNLVLLGQVGAGKSCTGNTILGQRIFHSKKSLKAVTEDVQRASVTVNGLSVDVYDTPGFLGPGVQSGEIERKCQKLLQLNSSAPTVFLWVISTDRFAEQEKKAADLVLSFLGSSNLQNTWIIFTKDDELESNELTIEQYMEGSKELRALVHKLNNQYLVFNNNGDPTNREQAEELIKTIVETNNSTCNCFFSQNQLSPIAQQNHLGTQKKMAEENMMSNLRFNLVMLGRNGVRKRSVGNTILGREAFTTIKNPESVTQAVTAEVGSACGLPITVYDTPGFSGTESEEDLWEYEKLLQKCELGLCAFLLVLQPGKFTEEDKKALVKIEEVLGEKRINNTWIIFSREDELVNENMTMDQFIDEDEATKELILKYEDRFYMLSNCLKKRQEEKKTLMSMIFKRSFDNLANEGPRRIPINPHLPVSRRLSRRIVLLGKSGVGKSSAGNTILGKKKFKSSGGLNSVTSKSSEEKATVAHRKVSVVDTPGFFDTEMRLEHFLIEIARSVYLSSPGPHAFLIVFPVNNRFTEQEEEIPQLIELMFGQEVLKYSIILFTHGDLLDGKSVQELIERNSRIRSLVDQCGGRYHVFNNRDEDNREQVEDLLQKIDSMIQQNGGGHYSNQMYEDALTIRQQFDIKQAKKATEERVRTEMNVKHQKQVKQMQEEMEKKNRAEKQREDEQRKQKDKERQAEIEGLKEEKNRMREQTKAQRNELEKLRAEIKRQDEEMKSETGRSAREEIQHESNKRQEQEENQNTPESEGKSGFKHFFSKFWKYFLKGVVAGAVIGGVVGGAVGGVVGGAEGGVVGGAVGGIVGGVVGLIVNNKSRDASSVD